MTEDLSRRWAELAAANPAARRLLPWAESLLDAARVSRTCGLEGQAQDIEGRVLRRLESVQSRPSLSQEPPRLSSDWASAGLPTSPDPRRTEWLWRRVRSLRARRLPFAGEGHPREQGLAWGPYNRQSAVAESLSSIASVDPLWVDDLLERERALRSIDKLLGLGS